MGGTDELEYEKTRDYALPRINMWYVWICCVKYSDLFVDLILQMGSQQTEKKRYCISLVNYAERYSKALNSFYFLEPAAQQRFILWNLVLL